ncbi:MAG: polyvinylalcohol dehydrogenase [Planctomycetota bacterium]|nr:MAG: polyvinylalcohol dehydrogenase [Planctomycetota bacterium]
MRYSVLSRLIPVFLAVVGAVLLYVWLRSDPACKLTVRLPGGDGTEEIVQDEGEPKKLAGKLELFDGTPGQLTGSWPRFRGSNFDNISTEGVELARNWPDEGPKVLWSIDVGEGYASAAVHSGRVYILDYDRDKQADVIRCLSFADGRDIWRYSYPVKIKRNHGMSRTVPAVTDKYLVALGPKCHVTCLDSVTGQFRWMLNLVREFGTKVPLWYAGQCPLIEDGKAIIAPGGDVLMIAADCETGEIIWKSPNPNKWQMTHSSIMPVEFEGMRMYVYCASGGVVGVSAEDGRILWETTEWKMRTNIPSPLAIGDGLIFLSAGYNQGSMMLKLTKEGEKIKAEKVFRLAPEVFGADQQTPIFYKGYIYGVRPGGQLTCLAPDGNIIWTSTSAHKFGLGPFIIADGLIFVMNDSGLLTLAEASPTGYFQLAEAKVLEGPDSWGPMTLASGRLILRDMNRMLCFDVSRP